jgi:hypothetical protein
MQHFSGIVSSLPSGKNQSFGRQLLALHFIRRSCSIIPAIEAIAVTVSPPIPARWVACVASAVASCLIDRPRNRPPWQPR